MRVESGACRVVSIALTTMAVLVSGAGVAQASRTLEPPSCGASKVVRDYLRPLAGMLPVQEIPMTGKLPFGPEGLTIGRIGDGLLVGGGSVGFEIGDEAIQQVRRLDWVVETRLSEVDGKGRVVAELGVRRRVIGTVEGNKIGSFFRKVSGRAAFYRLDISFQKRGTTETLGEYGTYSRVMRPREELRVLVDTPTVAPGDLVTARLRNLGTVNIESTVYDYGFNVEAFTGTEWVRIGENPPRGRAPMRMQILPAGMENRGCLRYRVPLDQVPGLFRFSTTGLDGELIASEFTVAARPVLLR